ncbi:hypothetical protein W909_12630 [Dickeya zeae EC1]|nr:hypothetical protein W909_12630 [Dickeya zeae EC1]
MSNDNKVVQLHDTQLPFADRMKDNSNGGNGGGDGMLETRVAKLESDVEHIKRDVTDIKVDFKAANVDISTIKQDIAVLKERSGHFATKS